MVERSTKRQKKNSVSEEDISTVLQRYTATTVLALLQEVAQQVQDVKIDWNAMVKKTTTGISNAREYQMLWRHLAYRDSLIDRLDDAAQPLDDDSDLECELEAFPAVSSEASAEAAACVKVLIASGVSNDPTGSTVEAPLTISIPKGQMSKALENSQSTNCTIGTNITIPISVQKQPIPSNANAEGLDSNGAANANLPRRKRKPWSTEEDDELIAAVKKCGEGNWANILKGDFKGDSTASQLSQRWNVIKKRKNVKVGTGSQISDVHLAARRAVDMAVGKSTMPACLIAKGVNSNAAHDSLGQPAGTETSSSGTQSLPPTQHDSVSTTALGASGSSKARVAPKRPSVMTTPSPESVVTKPNVNADSIASKSTLSPDSLVKATAVVAGARIGTPSDVASHFKAAQSKNAVHIMPACSLIKPPTAGSASSFPSNVHYIRTGLASRPLSSYPTAPVNASQPCGTHQMQGPCAKPASTLIQVNSTAAASDLSTPTETKTDADSVVHSVSDAQTVEKSSLNAAKTIKELGLEGQADFTGKVPSKQMERDQNAVLGNTPMDLDDSGNSMEDQVEGGETPILRKSLRKQTEGDKVSGAANVSKVQDQIIDFPGSGLAAGNGDHDINGNDKLMILPVEQEIPSASEEINENGSVSEIKEGPEEMVVDGNEGGKSQSQRGTGNGVTV